MAIAGIDLGTTNSLAAWFSGSGPAIIPNSFGDNLTPSVVSIDKDGTVYVGKNAKERMITFPGETVSIFKRDMGSPKTYRIHNREFTPEELSSFVIKKLKEDAEIFLGEPVTEAVISTPAYFNDAQRKATKAAGELAGLKVERIISEPTAAAIAYGFHNRPESSKCVVFDLGGGTFDVSVLEYTGDIMEVHAVAGDNYLGGEDFTWALARLLLSEYSIDESQLGAEEYVSLYNAAEEAKLRFASSASVSLVWTRGSGRFSKTVSADEYEKACSVLLSRLKAPLTRAITDAGVRLMDIDEVILVGGATRLPVVSRFVSRLLKKFPAIGVNPDEAVALGAAVAAAMKARDKSIRELILTDVCPYSLGTDIAMRQSNGMTRAGVFAPIIERNTVIPASRVERFYTVSDGQRTIKVEILQGESPRSKDNVFLGELKIDVPPAPAGEEAVDVRYTYDVNGILEVEVTSVSTGGVQKAVIEKTPGALSKESIERRLIELAPLKLHPRERDANKYLLDKAERYYKITTGEIRRRVSFALNEFEAALDSQESRAVSSQADSLKKLLAAIDESMFEV